MQPLAPTLAAVVADLRYLRNLGWGEPRGGHPEGTVGDHIAELERNLTALRPRLTEAEADKLRLLIHVHDTFKPDATAGVPIAHPQSHASLARAFLAEFCDDPDLLAMCQLHDEPYALWRAWQAGRPKPERLAALRAAISDWRLFVAFCVIDGCTAGKSREPLVWLLTAAGDPAGWAVADLL